MVLEAIADLAVEGRRLAISPDGRLWVAVDDDYATLWEDGMPAGDLPPAPIGLHDVRFSTSGTELLAAPARANLAARSWESLGGLRSALGRSGPRGPRIVTAQWAPAGDELVVAAEEPPTQRLVVFDRAGHKRHDVLWEDSEWMRIEAVAVGTEQIAAAALEVRLWWRDGFAPAAGVADRGYQVRRLAFSPAGDLLAVTYADGVVALIDPANGSERARWRAHADDASAVAFQPGGHALATAGWDDRVALWDLDGQPLAEVAVGASVEDLAFVAADRLVALRAAPDSGAVLLRILGGPEA